MKLENIDTEHFDNRMQKLVDKIQSYDPNKEPVKRLAKLLVEFEREHLSLLKERARLGDEDGLLDYQATGIDRGEIEQRWGICLTNIAYADCCPTDYDTIEDMNQASVCAVDYEMNCLWHFNAKGYKIASWEKINTPPRYDSKKGFVWS